MLTIFAIFANIPSSNHEEAPRRSGSSTKGSSMNIETAIRRVAVIDRRIDTVRAELYRAARIDPDAFDYDTEEGKMAALTAFHAARRDYPGFLGIELSLFSRRHEACCTRDALVFKAEKAVKRREISEYRKQHQTRRVACPSCGVASFARSQS
jgi:hypothetical protein